MIRGIRFITILKMQILIEICTTQILMGAFNIMHQPKSFYNQIFNLQQLTVKMLLFLKSFLYYDILAHFLPYYATTYQKLRYSYEFILNIATFFLIIKFIIIGMSQYRFLHQPQYASSIYLQASSQKNKKIDTQRSQSITSDNPIQSYYTTHMPRAKDFLNGETRKWGTRSKVETIKNSVTLNGRYQTRKISRNQNNVQQQQKKRSTSFYPQLQELKRQVSKIIQYSAREQQPQRSQEIGLSKSNSKKSIESYYQKNKEDINPQQILSDRNSIQKLAQSRRSSQFNYSTIDKAEYSQLKYLQLKTQLKNLKNRYHISKMDYQQKIQALTRKNQYLEKTLKSAHQQIQVYKNELSKQMAQIRKKLNSQQQIQEAKDQNKILEKNDDNQYFKQRISGLYNQILQKNKRINEILVQLHDSKGQIEGKNYQIATLQDKQKHHQAQLENLKKQMERKQKYLQIEIQKNHELNKKINTFNTKEQENFETPSTDIKQINNFDAKTHQQLETALKNEGNLLKMIRKLNLDVQKSQKRQRQLDEKLQKIQKQQQEKNSSLNSINNQLENKQNQIVNLTVLLQESRKNQKNYELLEKKYEQLQRQYQEFKYSTQTATINIKQEQKNNNSNQLEQKFKIKDQQIQKWKVQYLIAKGKIQDRQKMDKLYKNRRIQTYYQQYINLKSRNELIQPKLAELQQQNVKFMEKMKTMEINQLNIRIKMKNDNNALSSALQRTSEQLQSYKMREQQILSKSQEADKALSQSNLYRREIQNKILNSKATDAQLKQAISIIKNRISDQDQKLAKQFRQIKNKDSLIGKLRAEVQQLLTNKQADLKKIQIKDIRERVSEILSEQVYFVEQIKNSAKKQCQTLRIRNEELITENSQMKNKIYFIEEDIIKINHEKQKILQMYNSKLQQTQKHEAELNKIIQTSTKNYNDLYFQKNALQATIKTQLANKDQKIELLKQQIKNLTQYLNQRDLNGFSTDSQGKQLQETNSKLKKQLAFKEEQLTKLRDSYAIIRTEHQNLKSQIQIQKLKAISQRKNLQISLQIQVQNLKNQLAINQKKIISLIQKAEILTEQNKKKDGFIQNYIIGKNLPQQNKEFLIEFVKKYETVFTGQNIGSKLKENIEEIQKVYQINFNLLNEISTLKNKLTLYDKAQIQIPKSALNTAISVSTPYKVYRTVQQN